jgi:AAHS family 4-hydroxybenzoate transporter-like MFS transporter
VINIIEVIDREPIRAFQIRVFILCGLVQLLDGFDAQAIAFVAQAVSRQFGLNIASFGSIFGAGTLGMTLGALILPPLADRFGRRRLTIICTFIFAVFSLATAWADTFTSLLVLRLLAGFGLGAATPCLIPLVSEYSPKRRRAIAVSIVTACWPLGAVIGGALSANIIPISGWQSVFYIGGILPLLLVVVLIWGLPESIRFMAGQGQPPERIAKTLRQISPSLTYSPGTQFLLPEEKLSGVPAKHLFTGGRAPATVLLWIVFFINFIFLFFMFNWLPAVIQQAGQPLSTAILATVGFNLGGVIGGIIMGRLMDRYGQYPVLGVAYALAAIFVGSIAFVGGSVPYIMAAVVLAGFCSLGAQVCGNALAASLYPTMTRSTGVGWAYGIGRIGSIVGPVAGGVLLGLGWGVGPLFLVASLLLVGATVALILLWRVAPHAESGAAS